MSYITRTHVAALRMFLMLVFFIACAITSEAQDATTTKIAPAGKDQQTATPSINSQQLVSIDFNNVDIGVFIKFISDLTKKNFIIDDRVKGKVSIISPGKITVNEAYKVFESVLEVNGFAAVPAGEMIKIVSSPDARTKSIRTRLEEETGFTGDAVVTQLIPLRYANPEEIKRLFTPLVSKNSVILAYAPTNILIITDVQSNINRLLHILKAIDITGVGQQIAIVPVDYADASKLVTLLNSIFKAGQKGKPTPDKDITFVADERTNVIVVLASEADTENIRQLVKSLDKETPKGQAKIHVYYLEHASAEELVKVLQDIPEKSAAGKGDGKPMAPVVSDKVRITADKATNSLIIMAEQEDYVVLQSIIRQIDIPRAMVYIEALIMEVNVNKDFRLGTEWLLGSQTAYDNVDMVYGGGFSGGALGGDTGHTYSAGGQAKIPSGLALGIFGEALTISGITFPSIGAVVQAYQKDRDVRILSTPQILTTDNQEAKIYVGKNVPFQTQAGALGSTAASTYNTYEYRDVGKTLKITPTISKDRMVRLVLSLEVTDLEGVTDNRPTTLKRTVETTAIVKDQNTIVLGGLIDDQISSTNYKVPCLGDIPLLGNIFRSTAKGNSKTNLYIFLTPRVIQNSEEAKSVYQQKHDEIKRVNEKDIKLYKKENKEDDTGKGAKTEGRLNQNAPPVPEATLTYSESTTSGGPEGDTNQKTAPFDTAGIDTTSVTEPGPSDAVIVDTTPSTGSHPPEPTAESQPDAEQPHETDAGTELSTKTGSELASTPVKNNNNQPAAANTFKGKGFTVQVASFHNAETADKLLQELTADGYAAYTVRTEDAGKVWYRLRIGYFENPEAAEGILSRLRTKQFDPLLIKL